MLEPANDRWVHGRNAVVRSIKTVFVFLAVLVLVLFSAIVLVIALAFIFPGSQTTDLSHMLPASVGRERLEFSYAHPRNACDLEVYDLSQLGGEGNDPALLGEFSESVERTFSPWMPAIGEILYDEAYFHALNFDYCIDLINKEYGGGILQIPYEDAVPDTLVRIGGMTTYSTPLSHADSLIMLTQLGGMDKLILLRGSR